MPRTALVPEAGPAVGAELRPVPRQSHLYRLPHRRIDEAQGGYLAGHHLIAGVGGVVALTGLRVPQRALAIPHQPPDIHLRAQDAGTAARPAADGGVVPKLSVRPGDALAVEGPGDGLGALAASIVVKDPPDDRTRQRVRFAQAALRLAVQAEPTTDSAIAVLDPANRTTLADAPDKPSKGLVGQVLEVERAHRALQADMELRHLAFGEGNQPHLGEPGLLVEPRDMLEVARETVEALREDNIDAAGAHGFEERLIAGAQRRRAGDGGVVEGGDYSPTFLFGPRGAGADLVFDRRLTLEVGGVAGVDGAAGPHRQSFRISGVLPSLA